MDQRQLVPLCIQAFRILTYYHAVQAKSQNALLKFLVKLFSQSAEMSAAYSL